MKIVFKHCFVSLFANRLTFLPTARTRTRQRLLANKFYSKESFFVHRVNVYNCLLRSSYARCQVRRGSDPGKYVCVNTSRCEMFVVSSGSKGGGEHLLLVGMREWNFRWISLPLSCWCYCEMVNCYFQDVSNMTVHLSLQLLCLTYCIIMLVGFL